MEKARRLSALDEVLPFYRFRERHERTIAASPDVVWSALLAITTQDLPLSSLLMGIRGLPLSDIRSEQAERYRQAAIATFRLRRERGGST